MGGLSWEPQRRDVYSTKKKREREREANKIQKHQRRNKWQEPSAKLNSEAHCSKLGEECNFNCDILNPL